MDDIQIQNPSYAAERKQGDLTFYYLFFFFFPAKTHQKSYDSRFFKLNICSLLYLPRQEQHIGRLQMK